ncbi:MAG: hypothetical protein HN348_18615 [Proteobacteria bacterium]|jgi:hypothetical protein|nr:hypothetical protein [Pseudomonadota bacterium]
MNSKSLLVASLFFLTFGCGEEEENLPGSNELPGSEFSPDEVQLIVDDWDQSECLAGQRSYNSVELTATDIGAGTIQIVHSIDEVNCCATLEPDPLLVEPGVIDMNYIVGGETCYCMCPFEMVYFISGLSAGMWELGAEGTTVTVEVWVE